MPEVRQSVLHLLLEGVVGFALRGITGVELLLLLLHLRLECVKARLIACH